jgi:hypothetical protein
MKKGILKGLIVFAFFLIHLPSWSQQMLFDNGSFVNKPGAGFGGSDVSELQTTLLGGVGSLGYTVNNANPFRLTDQFTNTTSWVIDYIDVYAYQTGSTTTSTFTGGVVKIWDADPSTGIANTEFGDFTTNRMLLTDFTNCYRVVEGDLANTQRPIMRIRLNLGGVVIPAGTHWVEWGLTGSLSSGPFGPPVTILGVAMTGDAKQFAITGYTATLIMGNPPATIGIPFKVFGNDFGVTSISPNPVCAGGSITADIIDPILRNPGNVYTLELSDASGNFPGTLLSTTVLSPTQLSATVPLSSSGSSNYKVRVLASDPLATGASQFLNLTINSALAITCPSNQSANCSSTSCDAVVTYSSSPIVSGTPTPTLSYSFSGATSGNGSGDGSGSTFNRGTTTVTLTAVNSFCSQSCSFDVVVTDITPPTINCPANVSIDNTPGLCSGTSILQGPTVTDNCTFIGNAIDFDGVDDYVSIPSSSLNGTTSFTIETWIKPQSNSYGFVFEGANTSNPSLEGGGNNLTFWLNDNTFVQTGVLTLGQWYHIACTYDDVSKAQSLYVNGVSVGSVTALATGALNNLTLGMRGGNSLPYHGSMDEFRIWNSALSQAQIQANMYAEVNAQPGLLLVQHFNQGNANGNNSGTSTAFDASGNNLHGSLHNFTLNGSSSNWVCGVSGCLNNNAPATAIYPIGNTTVTWTATDAAGNTNTCNQIVTVVDNEVPVITCPTAGLALDVDPNECNATATFAATASDNCGIASAGVTYSVGGNSITFPYDFPVGSTTVTASVTDVNNNTSTCDFTVVVTDNISPSITCPGNITQNNDVNLCGAIVNYTTPVGTDNCAGVTTTQTAGLPSGSFFPVGTTTNTFVVTDAAGNTATCLFTITIADAEAPTISCSGNISIYNVPGFCSATTTLIPPTIIDNCPNLGNSLSFDGINDRVNTINIGPASIPVMTFEAWVYRTGGSGNQTIIGNDNGGWDRGLVVVGNEVHVWAGMDINTGFTSTLNTWEHYMVSWSPTQVRCIKNGTQVFTTSGELPSSSNVPGSIGGLVSSWLFPFRGKIDEVRIWNRELTQAQVIANMNLEIDSACGILASYHFNQGVSEANNSGIVTALDASGNGNSGILNNFTLNGSTSNWVNGQSLGYALSNNAPCNFPIGITNVVWTATDAHGNINTCNQIVTVVDNEAPSITCPANISVNNDANQCGAVVNYTTPVGTDNCAGVTTTQTAGLASGSFFPVGNTTNTFVVTDAAGNTATCSFTVTVADTTKPTIICSSNVNINTSPGLCTGSTVLIPPTVSDNCGLIGNALHFDGADDIISFPGSFPAFNNSALTLEAWIKSTNGGPGYPNSEIVTWSGGSGYSIVFRLANYNGNGRLQFLIYDNATVQYVEGTTDLNTNTWNHVSAVKNGNTVTLYLNGNVEATGSVSNGFVPANFSIGGGFANWDGTLDEVRIWHTARTQAQIQATMNIPVNAQPGLVALYHLDEGTANGTNPTETTANDSSGNGYHGTLTNFALTGNQSNWVAGTLTNLTNDAPTTYPIGNTTVTWTATDAHGNSATCTQIVTVTDAQAPTLPITNLVSAYQYSTLSGVPLEDLSSGSTLLLNTQADDQSIAPLPMPFPFEYRGVLRSVFSVSSNGLVGFGPGSVSTSFTNNTSNGLINDVIYAPWDDFHTGTDGSVRYKVVGTSPNQKMVIEWNVRNFNGDGGAGFTKTFQLWLHETSNEIQMVFGNGTNFTSATIGLRGSTFADFNEVTTSTHTASSTTINDANLTWPGAGRSYLFAPSVGCTANINLVNATGQCGSNATWTAPAFTDNCGINAVISSHQPGDFFPIGTTLVTYTATDYQGNSSSCSFNVTVTDSEAPTITCPQAITLNANSSGCVYTGNLTPPTATDNCTAPITISGPVPAGPYSTGTTTVTWTATDSSGNSSTCTQDITVLPTTSNGSMSITSCGPYTWTATTFFVTGVYTKTFTNALGCDSVHVMYLTVTNSTSGSSAASACGSYSWNGTVYTSSGQYTQTFVNANGCDSVHTLSLTIHPATSGTSSAAACYSYTWNSTTYTSSGAYTQTFVNANGCDSVHTLQVTINGTTTGISQQQSCDSYTWNNTLYTTSGQYTHTYVNANGCDSVHTLDLTIIPSATGSSSATACDSYTWNTNTYTQSGTYTQTFMASNGCDSIHTLQLTINNSSSNTVAISAGGCYTWAMNGNTYTTSGTYTHTSLNQAGCVHTEILQLTVSPQVVLQTRVILSGPYNAQTGLMHDSLRVNNYIPQTEPYSASPFFPAIGGAGNEQLDPTILAVSGPDAIVDWLYLELRSASNPATRIATKRALLQRDGDVVSHVDGASPVTFSGTPGGMYYISVKHRNHLGVMSAAAVYLAPCAGSSFDFTLPGVVYVNPVIANVPRRVFGSVHTLWSGDASVNKNTKYNGASNDKTPILNTVGIATPNNTVYGYREQDCNMDGKVRYNNTDNDRQEVLNNVGVSTPNAILFQHTPN